MSGERASDERFLPVHGFVLAGGKSSRMGVDKATLEFCGRPMVEIAVEKLRGFCAEVGICGNREDLSAFAPVVLEKRVDAGPAAGIEAGLKAARHEWALFVPVDVPLVPVELLRRWADGVMGKAGCGASYLVANGHRQPSFCMARREHYSVFSLALEENVRKLAIIFDWIKLEDGSKALWVSDASEFAGPPAPSLGQMNFWFSNVNTPFEFDEAEAWAEIEAHKADPLRG